MKLLPFNLEAAKADPSRVILRGGLTVRNLVFDMKHPTRPICGIVLFSDGNEGPVSWTPEGRINVGQENSCDLMLKQESVKVTIWRDMNGNLEAGINLTVEAAYNMRRGLRDLVGEGEIPVKDKDDL